MSRNEDRAHGRDDTQGGALRTVGETAQLLGLSVRTLHYWEQRGLVNPAQRTWSDYRLYDDADVARLQRIMVYKATGMPLDEIADVLDSAASPADHLRRQRALLMDQQHSLRRMVEAVDKLLEDTMSEHQPTVQEVATILGDADFPAYQDEAQATWGDTDDWAISQRATAAMTKKDWRAMKERFDDLERHLAAACLAGVQPGSTQADGLAEEHRDLLSSYFPVSYGKHALLARGYVADERFRAHYDAVHPGLAVWLKSVIDANARHHGIDPDQAQWK